MKEIEEKYLKDHISAHEVGILDQQVSRETDEEIAARMEKRWNEDSFDSYKLNDQQSDEMWEHISSRALLTSERTLLAHQLRSWWVIAASVLLPIFMISSGYLFWKQQIFSEQAVVFATGPRERASVILPDGSKALLNENSLLTYSPSLFSSKKRTIDFDGEAYFEIAKDPNHPFEIQGDRNNVSVFGTKFNLLSRKKELEVILALEEGSVQLTATESSQQVNMHPKQRAILDKETGVIRLEEVEDIDRVSAWKQNELIFHNTPLRDVLNQLENTYDVTITVQPGINTSDLYTGTMSTNDININLKILEDLYHLQAVMKGRNITLVP